MAAVWRLKLSRGARVEAKDQLGNYRNNLFQS